MVVPQMCLLSVITEALFTEITVLRVVSSTSIVIAIEVGRHYLDDELDIDSSMIMMMTLVCGGG
jgi:hypothetical protein